MVVIVIMEVPVHPSTPRGRPKNTLKVHTQKSHISNFILFYFISLDTYALLRGVLYYGREQVGVLCGSLSTGDGSSLLFSFNVLAIPFDTGGAIVLLSDKVPVQGPRGYASRGAPGYLHTPPYIGEAMLESLQRSGLDPITNKPHQSDTPILGPALQILLGQR